MKERLLFIILTLVLISAGSAATIIPENLQIITEEYAPYNYVENGTLKGISVDLVEEILIRMGSTLTRDSFRILPWNEGYNLVTSTPDTILFSTERLPEREHTFLWAGPINDGPEVLFVRDGTTLVRDPDITGLRVVVLSNDCGKAYAIDAGVDEQKIVEVPLAKDAICLLENGSADAWVYNGLAGRHAIDQYAEEPEKFRIVKELGRSTYSLAFNLNTSADFVNEVNATIQILKRDRSQTGITVYERILAQYLPVQCSLKSTAKDMVKKLVNQTAASIASDAQGTIARINEGTTPYKDPVDRDLYVFVFDTKVQLMANAANTGNNGKNLSGTTDIYGKAFRDEMVAGALQNGTGWVSYIYSNPDSLGLYRKMSYYQLVNGSDGITYVVGAGRYVTCDEAAGNDDFL
jgi:polar amino acid transport system substrate-binding protein